MDKGDNVAYEGYDDDSFYPMSHKNDPQSVYIAWSNHSHTAKYEMNKNQWETICADGDDKGVRGSAYHSHSTKCMLYMDESPYVLYRLKYSHGGLLYFGWMDTREHPRRWTRSDDMQFINKKMAELDTESSWLFDNDRRLLLFV